LHSRNFRNGRNREYTLSVSVSNQHEGVLKTFKQRFGGSIHFKTDSRVFIWTVTNKTAELFLRAVFPHCVIKKPQVLLAFKFRKGIHKKNTRLTLLELRKRAYYVMEMKRLKRAYRQ
jgi:hypothetical protein